MTSQPADNGSFSTSDDTLVLAAASSPIESELLATWLDQHRARHPETNLEVLALPDKNPSPGALAQLVEQLESD
ncbi:MAG: glycerol-3-phosphate O-acyltransferase, partial [Mycobacterium sp.]|nr:glycerol-3-phosphate O-acyltransferase [Mycobacterium sp.]